MKQFIKHSTFGLAALVLSLIGLAGLVPQHSSATGLNGTTQVIAVSGTFETLAETCPPPDDDEQCVIDELAKYPDPNLPGLIGTNKLITVGFTETETRINYHDASQISTQYGGFVGNEYGTINVQTGAFHSLSRSTSTDGCGSKLTLVFDGQINLDTLEDSGTYTGVLVKKTC